MAQIFPVAQRGPGISESADKIVPAVSAGKAYEVRTSIAQADLDDPTVTFDLRMYVKRNGVYPTIDPAVHNEDSGCTFRGGPNLGKNGAPTAAPGWREDGNAVAGQTVKFWLNVTGRAFSAGLNATQV